MSKRYALLVACDQYNDSSWHRLLAPLRDAEDLAQVLAHEQIGGFSVEMCLNKTRTEVEEAIEQVCSRCESGDTLLLYFSCHGEKDQHDELLFLMTGSKRNALRSTSLPASELQSHLLRCRARQQILLLDCCYSGAFGETMRHKGTPSQPIGVGTGKYFTRTASKGLCVVSATDSIELGYERNGQSQFTRVIVEGLKSGQADRDRDGVITIDELFDHVSEKLSRATPQQTPVKNQSQVQGKVVVGYAPQNARPRRTRRRNTGPELDVVSGSPVAAQSQEGLVAISAEPQANAVDAARAAPEAGYRTLPAASSSQSVPPVPAPAAMPPSRRQKTMPYAWVGLILVLACSGFAGGRFLLSSQRSVLAFSGSLMPSSAPTVANMPEPSPPMAAGRPAFAPPQVAAEGAMPTEATPQKLVASRPPNMVRVPAGRYPLGSRDRTAQNPPHEVELLSFEIDVTEVTVADYGACVHKRACSSPLAGNAGSYCNWTVSGREHHPINCVTFEQAEQYCRWAGKRLPTDDEWELAARGADGGQYPWGDEPPTPERANICGEACKRGSPETAGRPMPVELDGARTTAEVGRYPRGHSPHGLHDVAGNVWEWVTTSVRLPPDRRMALGGSWQSPSVVHFRADRRHSEKNGQWGHTGFRCVR